jgi:hypothetical protein
MYIIYNENFKNPFSKVLIISFLLLVPESDILTIFYPAFKPTERAVLSMGCSAGCIPGVDIEAAIARV